MGCKTRRSKHLFKNKKSLRYRNKKRRTQKAGGGEGEPPAPGETPAKEPPAPGEEPPATGETPPATGETPPATGEPAPGTNGQKDDDIIANTIISNVNKASSIGLQFFNNSVSGVLDGVAKKMNIDSSKPALDVASEGAAKLAKIASIMGTPEGDKLKEKFSNVLVELVDTTKPALDEVTKVGEEFLDKSGTAVVNAGLNMVGAVPGVGTTVELVRVLNNAGQAFNAGMDAAADLTKVGSDAAIKIHAITDRAGDLVKEANNLAENANNLTELPDPNNLTELSDPNNLTDPSNKLLHTAEEASTNINRRPHTYSSMRMQADQGGGGMRTLSQLQKAGKRIENRVESSLKEFHKNTKTRKKVRFNL
jgi:hypothetical protein